MELRERLSALLDPVVESLGYELLLLEFVPGRRNALLRVYIDAADGIGIEDCERVSREVAAQLDVEDPIAVPYRLEVSSPGLDRPLVKREHYERFAGEMAKIEMIAPVAGQRRFRGLLCGLDGDAVVLETAPGQRVALPFADIERARLIPDYERELKNS